MTETPWGIYWTAAAAGLFGIVGIAGEFWMFDRPRALDLIFSSLYVLAAVGLVSRRPEARLLLLCLVVPLLLLFGAAVPLVVLLNIFGQASGLSIAIAAGLLVVFLGLVQITRFLWQADIRAWFGGWALMPRRRELLIIALALLAHAAIAGLNYLWLIEGHLGPLRTASAAPTVEAHPPGA